MSIRIPPGIRTVKRAPPGRLSRAESQAQTRRRLIEAASLVFAHRGFQAARLEEVAARARYTKGAVYSNFRSKDALFLAVLETRMRERVESYRQLAARARAVPGRDLAGLLPRLNEPGEATWCLLQLEFWLYAMRRPAVRRRMAALSRQYRARLAPLVTRYARRSLRPAHVVAVALALYHGLTLQWHSDPRAIPSDLVARVLRALEQGPRRAAKAAKARLASIPRD